jgi:hypothetical protein
MQRVLSRLLTDQDFGRRLLADDPAAWAPYELSPVELQSLRELRVHRKRIVAHAGNLAHARLELALKGLPLSAGLLDEQLHHHIGRFCREFPPEPRDDGALLVETGRLVAFALRLLEEGALGPPYARDVLVFEQAVVNVQTTPAACDSAAWIAALNARPLPGGDLRDLLPVCGPHVVVRTFRYDLPELLPSLIRGEPPAGAEPLERPLHLLILKRTGRPYAQTLQVNLATAALLGACTGNRTVGELLADVEGAAGDVRIEDFALDTLRRLRDLDAVALTPRGGGDDVRDSGSAR